MTDEEIKDAKLAAFVANKLEEDRLVTVCDQCYMASCWRGIFRCEGSINAGTVQMPVWHLRELDLEHPDNYAASEDFPEPAPRCNFCGSEIRSGNFDPCDCI